MEEMMAAITRISAGVNATVNSTVTASMEEQLTPIKTTLSALQGSAEAHKREQAQVEASLADLRGEQREERERTTGAMATLQAVQAALAHDLADLSMAMARSATANEDGNGADLGGKIAATHRVQSSPLTATLLVLPIDWNSEVPSTFVTTATMVHDSSKGVSGSGEGSGSGNTGENGEKIEVWPQRSSTSGQSHRRKDGAAKWLIRAIGAQPTRDFRITPCKESEFLLCDFSLECN